MTWVRYDDQFPIHRKVAGLSDVLYRLHSEAIFWAARNTTDGVIRAEELGTVSRRATPERAAELVRRGLWHDAGRICARCKQALADAGTPEPADGWVLHGYLEFQPSRAKIEREREQKADRQRRWLDKKTGRRGPPPSNEPSEDASKDSVIDANPAPAPPRRKRGGEPAPSDRTPPLRASASGGGRNPENPDWRTLPPIGAPRNPSDADRARRGAAAARAQLRQPREQP